MQVNQISFNQGFGAQIHNETHDKKAQNSVKENSGDSINIQKNNQQVGSEKLVMKKPSILDKFETEIKNSADMNDTIQVPRTIFKGYLAFMSGTALFSVAALTRNKLPKVSKFLNAMNGVLVTYGTYSFVRPYLIKPEQTKIQK